MAVGAQTTQAAIDSNLSALATGLRDLAVNILQAQAYYNKLGLTGLAAAGYTAPDAQAVLDNINHMATVAKVYNGTATQAALFNFEDYLTPIWGAV